MGRNKIFCLALLLLPCLLRTDWANLRPEPDGEVGIDYFRNENEIRSVLAGLKDGAVRARTQDLMGCLTLKRIATYDLDEKSPGKMYCHYFLFSLPAQHHRRSLMLAVNTEWRSNRYQVTRVRERYSGDFSERPAAFPNPDALRIFTAALEDAQVLAGLAEWLDGGSRGGVRQISIAPPSSEGTSYCSLVFHRGGFGSEFPEETVRWTVFKNSQDGELVYSRD